MCDASGDPSPTVRWLRHDVEVGLDHDQHLEAEHGGLLMIHNVTLEYDDWYECEASNGIGPAQRRVVIIDVLGTPSTVQKISVSIKQLCCRRGRNQKSISKDVFSNRFCPFPFFFPLVYIHQQFILAPVTGWCVQENKL